MRAALARACDVSVSRVVSFILVDAGKLRVWVVYARGRPVSFLVIIIIFLTRERERR